jgi:hypothetical protein
MSKRNDLLLSLLLLGTLETNNERYGHVEVLGGLDDTLGDVVAAHDTTKDVDEDALHLGIREQNLKGALDSLGAGTSVLFNK